MVAEEEVAVVIPVYTCTVYSTRSLSTTSHLYELKRLVHAVEVTVYTCTVKVIEYNLTFL